MIEIKNITKDYAENKTSTIKVLKGINLTVEDGDIYGVIGVSGAGKSTLLRLIGLMDKPTSGEIFVNGEDISKLDGSDKINYYKRIGNIFQHYNLLMQKNVFENVAFPLKLSKMDKSEIAKRVNEMLEVVGLSDKAKAYPSTLSGGQKQRVAIARAMVVRPQLVLCDEPTSALDSITTDSILELLKKMNDKYGVTVIIITHDINVVKKICNKVAVLEKGMLVDNGTVAEVQSHNNNEVTKMFFGNGANI